MKKQISCNATAFLLLAYWFLLYFLIIFHEPLQLKEQWLPVFGSLGSYLVSGIIPFLLILASIHEADLTGGTLFYKIMSRISFLLCFIYLMIYFIFFHYEDSHNKQERKIAKNMKLHREFIDYDYKTSLSAAMEGIFTGRTILAWLFLGFASTLMDTIVSYIIPYSIIYGENVPFLVFIELLLIAIFGYYFYLKLVCKISEKISPSQYGFRYIAHAMNWIVQGFLFVRSMINSTDFAGIDDYFYMDLIYYAFAIIYGLHTIPYAYNAIRKTCVSRYDAGYDKAKKDFSNEDIAQKRYDEGYNDGFEDASNKGDVENLVKTALEKGREQGYKDGWDACLAELRSKQKRRATNDPEAIKPAAPKKEEKEDLLTEFENELSLFFSRLHKETLSKISKSATVKNADNELVPFIYAIADMTGYINKSLRDSIAKALHVYRKAHPMNSDVFKKRVNLYASAIRKEIHLRGVWLLSPSKEKWEEDWIMFCCAVLGDILISPSLGDNYNSGRREYFDDIEVLLDYPDDVIVPIIALARCINQTITDLTKE